MNRAITVLAGGLRRAYMRNIGRKLFVGLTAPLVVVLLAVPAKADSQDDKFVQQLKSNGKQLMRLKKKIPSLSSFWKAFLPIRAKEAQNSRV